MSGLAGYPHRRVLGTRWADNDVYGHVNNVEFYALFDTLINAWLIREGGLDIRGGPVIGLCAESHAATTPRWPSRTTWWAGCAWPTSAAPACATTGHRRRPGRRAGGHGLVRARVRRPRHAPPGADRGPAARVPGAAHMVGPRARRATAMTLASSTTA